MKTRALVGVWLLLAIVISIGTPPVAAQSHVLYDDALQNAWDNYSWATVDLNATTPVRGTKSIRVDAPPYTAVYFNHAALDVSVYQSLSFWLHFGATTFAAGPLVVQVRLEGGAEGPTVALTAGQLPPDTATWTQAVLPLSSLGIPAGTRVTGFYIRNFSNNALPTFYVDDVALTSPVTTTGDLSVAVVTSDNGLPARAVQWKDAGGKPRTAVMVDQRPQGAGYLRQLTYQVAGVDRVCRGTGANGHQGDGYVQNHTASGGSSSSHSTPGTTTVVLNGRHHAIISYDLPGYTISGQAVPTRVQWFFANGKSHPIFALSQDARALAGNLGADSRSPYGDVDYAASPGTLVGGASFGDTYKFATLATAPERVTRSTGWRYNEPNTIPYAMQWTEPAQTDAEMGHVATLPIGIRDQGSDTRTYPAVDLRGTQDLDGPMINDESWSYQILNYVLPTSGATNSRRLTWGTNWGLPGGFNNYGNNALNIRQYSQHATSQNGAFNGARADGMLMAYSVFVVLGTHTGGYLNGTVGQTVKQMENAAVAGLTATVGTVSTTGPAGIGNAALTTITYSPAGYNPTYSVWDITAAGNAVNATLSPAAGKPLDPGKGLTAELIQMMASPLPKTGLQLRVSAIAKKGVGKNADVEVLIETLGRDLTFTEKNGTFNNRLSMSLGVFNKEGKSVTAERPDVDLNLRPETHARVIQNGVRILRHLSVPPGRYQLRVAAQDSGKARQGSAIFDLDVPDFTKNALAMSNVVLAATADRAVYSPPKPGFDPFNGLLPGAPSAMREFPNESEVAAVVEVYVNKPTPAHRLDITTTVKADDGRVVFTHSEERSTEELHGTPGGFGYPVRIPIKGWTPGLYVLTIEAASRLSGIEPASRVIQFEVK